VKYKTDVPLAVIPQKKAPFDSVNMICEKAWTGIDSCDVPVGITQFAVASADVPQLMNAMLLPMFVIRYWLLPEEPPTPVT